MMAVWYLGLAVFLAVTLNQRNRVVRGLGTAVAALSLLLMVSSIFLTDFDGTFAHRAVPRDAIEGLKPLILKLLMMTCRGEPVQFFGASLKPFFSANLASSRPNFTRFLNHLFDYNRNAVIL